MRIEEDYVTFETAKLLRKKSFKESTYNTYYEFDDGAVYMHHYNFSLPNSENKENEWSCPTILMTLKWLREVHHIFVQIELYSKYDDYCYEIFQNTHRLMLEKRETFSSPEEAADSAIKYCLEHLI